MLVPTIVAAAVLFWVALTLERKAQSRSVRMCLWGLAVVLALPGLLFALYYVHLFDNAAWFYNLRTVRYTELLGCGLGLAAGILHSWWQPESFGEKIAAPAALAALVMVPFVKPLLDPLDLSRLQDRCPDNICMQSTFSTCGPASAATLLRAFGKLASEEDLAKESFTSRGGTEVWYLSRSLRRRGVKTTVVVRPQWNSSLPSPAIAGVLLPGGAGHFIAVLESSDYQVEIADPLRGKVVIPSDKLSDAYRFTGFFLVLNPSGASKQ